MESRIICPPSFSVALSTRSCWCSVFRLAASAWAMFESTRASASSHGGKGFPPAATTGAKVAISFTSPDAMRATTSRAPLVPRQSTETNSVLPEYFRRRSCTTLAATIDLPIPLSPVTHTMRLAAALSVRASIASK